MPYIIAFVVIVVVGVSFTLFQNSKPAEETTDTAIRVEEKLPEENNAPTDSIATEPAPETPTAKPEVTADAPDYNDGSYTTSVTYTTPKNDEYSLDITLTIANDVVVDTNVVYSQGAEKDPNAQRFDKAYEALVIGKDMDAISLSRVGGASLTTGAFNNALAKIKYDAGA